MAGRWVIYGATGFTGRMLVRGALARGLSPLLAGRDAARLHRLADPLGLEHRAVRLDDPPALVRLLDGAAMVLNAAGPFAVTAGPLVAACLAARTHYVDVTGEPAVFVALGRRDEEARRREVMLLPGAGFVVAASDCLAAHVARRLPGALKLRLGVSRPAVGRGTLRTAARYPNPGVHVRRNGRLTLLPGCRLEREFDYGRGPRASLAVDWADTVTAYHTTGIPDIAVYLEVLPREKAAILASRLLARGLRAPLAQTLLRMHIDALPEGPAPAERRRARNAVVAEAEDSAGRLVRSRLRTPDVYAFTADAALAVAERVLARVLTPGFQTPARAYGADFVLGLEGVLREDLAD